MKRITPLTATFLFFSGMAALLYQTAWERMLRLVFGASTFASSAVLAIFLGGLGVGGWRIGRRAERHERPLELYGNLEAGVALLAMLTPLLVDLVSRLYYALGGQGALGVGGATLVRLVFSALVLGPPVVLMGGTLPAAARAAESDDDLGRGRLATLYAANTCGAVLGALLGTFLLFELFGTRLSLWTAALINLLVAVIARRVGLNLPKVVLRGAEEAPSADETESDVPRPITLVVFGAAAAVGFAFLGLEIVWYRLLGPLLGGSSFTFGLILATALAGIGLGGFLYSRRAEGERASLTLLALTIALEAVFVAAPLAFGDGLAFLSGTLRTLSALGFWTLVATWAVVAALAVFPAALVSGYQFSVLFALLGSGRRGVARQVGLAYAFNTGGSILGSLLVGFVLLPRIGTLGTWRLLSGALVALSVVVLATDGVTRRWKAPASRVLPALAALLGAVLLGAPGPTAVTRHTPIGAGRVSFSASDRNGLHEWVNTVRSRVLWEQDGVESSVGVLSADGVAFLVNGKSDGAVINDRGTQGLLGVLPALLHPGPKDAFVLGLGTGMSAGWLSTVPGVEHVDVAELEPAILGVARECRLANQDVLARPNVKVFLGDGREFLLTHDRKYDLIVSEPSNPYRAGIASLFTADFYAVVSKRLAQGGMFGQWVQGYEIDVQTLRIVLATMHSVFPHVEAWQTQGGDFLILASFEPHVIDVAQMRQRLTQEPYRTLFPRAGLVGDAEGVLARFVARDELIRSVAAAFGTPINTDDAMLLDYAFARRVGIEGSTSLSVELMVLSMRRGLARPDVVGEVDWARVDELRSRAWLVAGGSAPDLPLPDPAQRARAQVFGLACTGDVRAALRLYHAHPFEPRDIVEVFVVGKVLAQERDERALAMAERLKSEGYVAESHAIRARYFAALGKKPDAAEELLLGIAELRKTALPLCSTARETLNLLPPVTMDQPPLQVRVSDALLGGPLAVYQQEERRVQTLQRIAFLSKDTRVCVASLGRQLTLPWWNETFLRARADCLERAGHPLAGAAKEDLVELLEATAGRIEAGLELPAAPSLPFEGPGAGPNGADAGMIEAVGEDAGTVSEAPSTDASDAPFEGSATR